VTERAWTDSTFRSVVGRLADRVIDGDVEAAAMDLWQTAFSNVDQWLFAEGLWNIWGRITDEFTHPSGDTQDGLRLATEAAAALGHALNDEARERVYCDSWIYERLDIVDLGPPPD
jgi:hypothetical protein